MKIFILQSNRSILRLIIIFFFIHLFYISAASSQEENYFQTHSFSIATNKEGLSYILGQVIVKYKSPRDEYSLTASSFNLESAQVYEVKDMFSELGELDMYKAQEYHPFRNRYYIFEIDEEADVEEVCQELMQNPDIEYAEPSYIFPLPEPLGDSQVHEAGNYPNESQVFSRNPQIPKYDFPVQKPEPKFRYPIELPESNNYPNDPYFHSKGSWGTEL